MLQRQQLLATFPVYRQLVEAAAPMYDALRAGPVIGNDAAETKKLDAQYDAWAKNAGQRIHLLLQLAPRRVSSSLEFPPLRTTAELQKMLDEGEALVVFHGAAGELYGFLVTGTGTHVWQIGDVRRLRTGVADFLRALGNYGPNRPLSAEELSNDRWRKIAADAYSAVFSAARLDLAKTKSLVIVPDDLLWYLPLEALVPDAAKPENTLADRLPIRYGPTAALAMRSPRRPLRRTQHTGIVANDLSLGANEADTEAMLAEFENAVVGALRLPAQLPVAANLLVPLLDSLVVLDDVDPARLAGIGSLLPRGRGTAADAAESAVALPFGGPQHVIVTGFTTAAEQGLRPSRRNAARDVRPGSEVFQTLCGMMATGARTIVLSRWRTGGRTNLELVREYVRELPQLPATEAWQRARLLARETPVDPLNEPRLKGVDDDAELPTADHPFFWAGYLIVDTGPRKESSEETDQADENQGEAKPTAEAASSRSDEAMPDVRKANDGTDAAQPTGSSTSYGDKPIEK
jgi:hypothetical protein